MPQDPQSISIQTRLDNWGAVELAHIPGGSRGTLVRSWYAQQGFLARAAASPYAEQIVAAGAWSMLLTRLDQHYAGRVTRDLDVTLPEVSQESELRKMLDTVIATPLPKNQDDHLVFEPTYRLEHILPGTEAGGYRAVMRVRLGPSTRILFTLDVALQFEVVPAPELVRVPRLLRPTTTIPVRVAPIEAVLAGKMASLLKNGFGSTRRKDFYDCWLASQQHAFSGDRMSAALVSTCRQQGVALDPQAAIFTASDAPEDAWKEEQWEQWLVEHWIAAPAFPVVVRAIRALYLPVVEGTAAGCIWRPEQQRWIAAQAQEEAVEKP